MCTSAASLPPYTIYTPLVDFVGSVKVSALQPCSVTLPVALYFSADPGSQGDLDLTELIGVPLPPSVSFVTGFEGYPAYSFGPGANVGRLTKSFIPDPFYYDFAITVTAKPTTQHGGVLFAITDAYQKVTWFVFTSLPYFTFCCK